MADRRASLVVIMIYGFITYGGCDSYLRPAIRRDELSGFVGGALVKDRPPVIDQRGEFRAADGIVLQRMVDYGHPGLELRLHHRARPGPLQALNLGRVTRP